MASLQVQECGLTMELPRFHSEYKPRATADVHSLMKLAVFVYICADERCWDDWRLVWVHYSRGPLSLLISHAEPRFALAKKMGGLSLFIWILHY